MTELVLICAVGLLGLAFAATVGRWLLARPTGDLEMARAAALVERGAASYLRRQNVVSIAVAAVVGALVLLGYGVAYQAELVTAVAPREFGVWSAAAYVSGAGLCLFAGWVAAWAARTATARVAAGTHRSLDESLQIAIRAAAVPGVVAPALALLGLAGLYLLLYWYRGDGALEAAARLPRLIPGFALGAVFVALLGQLGGGIFGTVADLGADVAGKLEASLPEDSRDNPATLADLVGDHVKSCAARATTTFALVALEGLAAMLAASLLFRENAELPSATALVLLPLVGRSFGLLAAWFGVMVVRTDDREGPMNAIVRGQWVTTLLCAIAAVGTVRWLLPVHWLAFGGCALVGASACLLVFHTVQYYAEQRYRPVRRVAEAARGGPTLAVLRGAMSALELTVLLLLVVLVAAFAAHRLGATTGLAHGGLFGLALACGGLTAAAPYSLALEGLGGIVDSAGGVVHMTMEGERPDVRARARLLDDVGATVKCFARALGGAASALACFLLIIAFLSEVWLARGAGRRGVLDLYSPVLYAGGVAGLGVVLTFAWATSSRVIAATRDVVRELRAELAPGSEVRPVGSPLAPAELLPLATPDDERAGDEPGEPAGADDRRERAQLACVEMVSRAALRAIVPTVAIGLGVSLAIVVVLRLCASGDRVSTTAEALVAFLIVATIAGATGSLLLTNAGSAWDNAKKYIREEVDNPTYVAAVIGDTIGDPLQGAIAPATRALVETLAALALVLLPFFL